MRDFHAKCVKITPCGKVKSRSDACFWPKTSLVLRLLTHQPSVPGASHWNGWIAEGRNFSGNMRTLLRKIPSGLYFQGPDQWTSDPAEALDFKAIDRALKFVATWDLKDVELAFAFNDLDYVTAVPVEKTLLRYSEPGE